MWRRFVALGDSLTEGVGDPIAGGSLRGWAARLAVGLAELEPELTFVNLARRGLLTDEIRTEQLSRALELKPDLTSAIVGMNDLTRPGFDPDVFAGEVDRLVSALAESGATVLMASFPDISSFTPLPPRVRRSLHDRLETASAVVRDAARSYDAVFLDVWEMSADNRRRVMSIDRMHPNERGHLFLARGFADALEVRSGVRIELPDLSGGRLLSLGTFLHLRWLAQNAGPEVYRSARRILTAKG